MTREQLNKIINDAEKYDAEATTDQIRHNLYSAIIEHINTFGIIAFFRELNDALSEKQCKAELKINNVEIFNDKSNN